MARLIDVTDLINTCKNMSDEHETTSISYNALYEVLLQQPIAYDVEKVVEQVQGVTIPTASQHTRIISYIRKGGVSNG